MRKFILPIVVTVVGLTALIFNTAMPNKALAQNNNDVGQALEIGPPLISLKADPGETLKTKIQLRNIAGGDLIVTNQINDFTAAGEDGTPQVLLDEDANAEPTPYSLKNWISPLKRLVLKPKEIESLSVTIKVPDNASPGSYYGVVRFTAVPPELEGTGVSLSASLGSLIFVRVNGDAKESMGIEEFYASKDGKRGWLFESNPIDFVERLKNTGNVHLQPRGQITIYDMFGNTVTAIIVNQPPHNVLPASIRKFEQSLGDTELGDRNLFGRYTAELTIAYGEDEQQTITEKVTFWVIPWKLIAGIIVLLIVGFFALRFAIKRYNERIISKSRRR
jgi:hypothetical protein